MSILTNIITELESATNLPVKPFDTDTIEECLVYKYSVVSDTGAVAQNKLELRIITTNMSAAASIEAAVKSALITVGDSKKIEGINSIVLNGGGVLKDYETNTIHTLLYFIITNKSEV